MKEIIRNLFLFVIFAFAFSALTNCGGSSSNVATGNDSTATNTGGSTSSASPEVAKEKTPSEYPPLASSVAQADIKNLDGSTFKVADKKGKVILLNMWATWCGPCRGEMPALVKLQNEYGSKGFEIVGLNTDDEDVNQIKEFAQSMNLNYTLAWADTKTQVELLKISKFQGIPQSFLIDRDGNLRGVFTGGGASTIQKLDELVPKVVSE